MISERGTTYKCPSHPKGIWPKTAFDNKILISADLAPTFFAREEAENQRNLAI